jgi:hypothetical protein
MRNLEYIFAALVFLQSTGDFPAVPSGVITARVVDQGGNPVPGAVVQMAPADGSVLAMAVPECLTDEAGVCSCERLPFGRYSGTAAKVADGYPDVSFSLYGRGEKPPIAEITPQTPIASISITLGPRAASIAVKVIDEATGLAIKNPTVVLRSAAAPSIFLSTGSNSDSKILIPADEDIIVEVSAEGYKTCRVATQPGATHANALRLRSEETRQFTISLKAQ